MADPRPFVQRGGRIHVVRIAGYRVPTTECILDLNPQKVNSEQEAEG